MYKKLINSIIITLIIILASLKIAHAVSGGTSYVPLPTVKVTGPEFAAHIDDRFTGIVAIQPVLVNLPFSSLPPEIDGQSFYCKDCRINNPCITGGTGAVATGINGIWDCAGASPSNPLPLNLLPNQSANYNGHGFVLQNLGPDSTTGDALTRNQSTINSLGLQAADYNASGHQFIGLGGITSSGPTNISGNQTNGADVISHINVNGVLNVATFGTTGNGTTDDTAALQSALNSGSTHIYLPNGTYKVGALTVPSSVSEIECQSWSTVLSQKTAGANIFDVTGSQKLYIHNCAFQGVAGNGFALSNAGISLHKVGIANGTLFDNQHIRVIHNWFRQFQYMGVAIDHTTEFAIEDNFFDTTSGCAEVFTSQHGKFVNNVCNASQYTGFSTAFGADLSVKNPVPFALHNNDIGFVNNTVYDRPNSEAFLIRDCTACSEVGNRAFSQSGYTIAPINGAGMTLFDISQSGNVFNSLNGGPTIVVGSGFTMGGDPAPAALPTWPVGTTIGQGDVILPAINNPGNFIFRAVTAGVTNPTPPNSWPQGIGQAITDNTVYWKNIGSVAGLAMNITSTGNTCENANWWYDSDTAGCIQVNGATNSLSLSSNTIQGPRGSGIVVKLLNQKLNILGNTITQVGPTAGNVDVGINVLDGATVDGIIANNQIDDVTQGILAQLTTGNLNSLYAYNNRFGVNVGINYSLTGAPTMSVLNTTPPSIQTVNGNFTVNPDTAYAQEISTSTSTITMPTIGNYTGKVIHLLNLGSGQATVDTGSGNVWADSGLRTRNLTSQRTLIAECNAVSLGMCTTWNVFNFGSASNWAGAIGTVPFHSTGYFGFGNDATKTSTIESITQTAISFNAVLSNLYCNWQTFPSGLGYTFTVRVNHLGVTAGSLLSVVATGNVTSGTDLIHSVSIQAGDKLDVEMQNNNISGSSGASSCSFQVTG